VNEAEEYFGKSYKDDPKLYQAKSPITYVKQVNTPILIVHGDADFRVPVSQAHEWYESLVKQKKSVQLHIMPNQAHIPTDANETLKAIHHIEKWLEHIK
jgi:dipeptidyl aminopeptidase/acylaminoacyl peptidase